MCYEDNVLIKLRRDYSKDEVVMHALNLIKELKIERGKNNSYIEELVKELSDMKSILRKNKKPKANDSNLLIKIEKYKKASLKKEVNLDRQRIRMNELKKENSRLKSELILFGRNT